MKREKIAVDLDDVLADHVEAFIEFSNQSFGTNLGVDDYSNHWREMWQVEQAEVQRRMTLFHVPEHIGALSVKEESREAMTKLSERFELSVVTARVQGIVDITHDWLNSYFPDVFESVHFVPIWETNERVSKADVCQQIGADLLIDDTAKHCNIVVEAGLSAILFGDYSWNREEPTAPGVVRCPNWPLVFAELDLDT